MHQASLQIIWLVPGSQADTSHSHTGTDFASSQYPPGSSEQVQHGYLYLKDLQMTEGRTEGAQGKC